MALHPLGDLSRRRRGTSASEATSPRDEVVDLPLVHVALELASVGAGSLPLNPPTAITGSLVASW